MENGMNVLQLRLLRALYVCMDSAILSYDLDAKTLKSQGLVVNLYDRCIVTSTIDGKQCKIAWYIEDNNVFHVDEHMSTRVIEAIV